MVSHSSCGCSCGASRAIRIRITSESLYGNLGNKDVCLMYWGVRVMLRHHVYVRSSRNHAANLPLNTLPIQRRIVACARINATLPFCFWLFQAVDVWFFNHRLNITLCMYQPSQPAQIIQTSIESAIVKHGCAVKKGISGLTGVLSPVSISDLI